MNQIELKLPGSDNFFVQEAFKVLRTNLQFCGQDIKVISFTSVNENEGKTTICLHVAQELAGLGKKVLVIDTDMRKSVIAGRNTNVEKPLGLSELLTGMASVVDCLYVTQNSGLQILFAGKYPPNPVELLNSKYFSRLVNEARNSYDYVIIDTPPLGRVIDAAVVAASCDGTVLVMSSGVRSSQARDVVGQLEKSGCKILGVVRNGLKQKNTFGRMVKYGE